MKTTWTTTSESVSEGHPDKVCDYIADSVVDAHLAGDAGSHVACEVLCKRNLVVVAGEISSGVEVDYERLVRGAIREIGYSEEAEPFCAATVQILLALTRQSTEIGAAVDRNRLDVSAQGGRRPGNQFGYATNDAPKLMPLPIALAHASERGALWPVSGGSLAASRRKARSGQLRKRPAAQLDTIVVPRSTKRASTAARKFKRYVIEQL